MCSSVVLPEPDGPVTTVRRPELMAAFSPDRTVRSPVCLARFRSSIATPPLAAARRGLGASVSASGTSSVPSISTELSASLALARDPIPPRRRSSSGTRSQPPRATTISSLSGCALACSALTRPSRMWTMRSAIEAEPGSWLTTIAVVPWARASSPISS